MTAFTDLGLSPDVVQAVHDAGYDVPTPIQTQAIPVALTGRDVLGIAQTGTGKTAAFTLPMIDRLAAGRARARMPRSLVLCPTRELADQVSASFEKYAKGQKLSWALLIGGVSFDEQVKKLDRGVDVLIATPGRLLDLFERGRLLLTGVQIMVVDEADRMLDMGFIPDLERIFKLTPSSRQTLFFSATMPPEITRLTTQFLKDPTRIEASRPATTAENIEQHVARIPVSDPAAKRMALRALAERDGVKNAIVFCNRKAEVDIVAKSLKKHGFDAAPIHGDLDQTTRTRTLESFRKGELKFLVASDVAARGLDIPAVSHIFNYDVPHHAEDYVHRIGRTGRAGLTGEAYTIVTPADARSLDKVLKLTKKVPAELTLDLDWSQAKSDGDRERPRRSSGRAHGDHRERPRADHGQRAAMEPFVAAESAATADPAPRAPEGAHESAAVSAPAPRSFGEGRAEGRSEGRDRSRRRGRREPAAASETTVATAQAAPPEIRPQPERENPAAPSRAPVPEQRRGGVKTPTDERDDNDRRVVGFGADTPAFLLRAPPPRKAEAEAVDN